MTTRATWRHAALASGIVLLAVLVFNTGVHEPAGNQPTAFGWQAHIGAAALYALTWLGAFAVAAWLLDQRA